MVWHCLYFSRSDEYSWKRSRELLVEVARKGEETGYGVPCLLIAAKEDRDPYPMAVQDSMRVYPFFQFYLVLTHIICTHKYIFLNDSTAKSMRAITY